MSTSSQYLDELTDFEVNRSSSRFDTIASYLRHHAQCRGFSLAQWRILPDTDGAVITGDSQRVYQLTTIEDSPSQWRMQLSIDEDNTQPLVVHFCREIDTQLMREPELTPSVWVATQCRSGAVSEAWYANDYFDHPKSKVQVTSREERQWQEAELCHYLSAFLVSLLQDYSVEDALLLAHASLVSRETWPMPFDTFPVLHRFEQGGDLDRAFNEADRDDERAIDCYLWPKVDREKMKFYPVVPSYDWVEKLLTQGVSTLQLRNKRCHDAQYLNELRQSIALGHQLGAQLFINDDWQHAIEFGAYGVHLGQQDLQTANLAAIHQAHLRLGISTHGYFEILNAMRIKPSYIALGHVFETTTKVMPSKPQGRQRLQQLTEFVAQIDPQMPTVAIGGINLDNAVSIIETGVSSIAVVRALTQARDLSTTLSTFNRIIDQSQWGGE